jgi:hypothetical protein
VLGEDDFVAARGTATGTFTGQWGDVEPTGKAATFSGVNIYRFNQSGKVAEIWNHQDGLGFMEQVGVSVWAGAAPEPPSVTGTEPPSRKAQGTFPILGTSGCCF